MKANNSQTGVALLEVLIAVLVLAIGVLGIAALQALALKNAQSAAERSQAVMQTYSILESIRAARGNDPANFDPSTYNYSDANCTMPLATDTTLRGRDIRAWLLGIREGLAQGCGTVNCEGNVCTVTVSWDDSRAKNGQSSQTITTRSEL